MRFIIAVMFMFGVMAAGASAGETQTRAVARAVVAAYNQRDDARLTSLLGDADRDGLFQRLRQANGTVGPEPTWTFDGLRLHVPARLPSGKVVDVRFYPATPDGHLERVGIIPAADDSRVAHLPSSSVAPNEIGKRVDAYLHSLAAQDRFSGVVLITQNGRTVFSHAYGYADLAFHIPNTPQTRFQISSMGKMLTAVAIAQLIDSGKLKLDETLAQALPGYPNQSVARRVTIAQMLSHTSGLGEIFKPEMSKDPDSYRRPTDYFSLFANEPQKDEGTFSYSNAGFVVLSAIVEAVSGESFDTYVQRHIYDVAGMHDTKPSDFTQVVENKAIGYSFPDEDPFGTGVRIKGDAFMSRFSWHSNGAGGEVSTVDDFDRFLNALTTGKLIRRETFELFAKPVIEQSPGGRFAYGYGFEVERIDGHAVVGHDGGGGNSGLATGAWRLPQSGFNVVIFTNHDSFEMKPAEDAIVAFLLRQSR